MADEESTVSMEPPKQTPAASDPVAPTIVKKSPLLVKKPVLRRPGDPAPAPAPVAQGIAIPHGEAAKKMTSRIPLSATSHIPDGATQATDATMVQAAKSKTSRISLEAAFTEPPPETSAPRTIKLKRPVEAATLPKPGQTSQIADVKAEPEVTESPNIKRTIKVKRGTEGAAPSISPSPMPSASPMPSIGDTNLQALSAVNALSNATPTEDKVNPTFIVAAVIGLIVIINLMWVLAAQIWGPNAAWADYAQAEGWNVPNPVGALVVD